jgi:hypothetical protein
MEMFIKKPLMFSNMVKALGTDSVMKGRKEHLGNQS